VVAIDREQGWIAFGSPLTIDATTPADQPSLILDENDAPIVAWSQSRGDRAETIQVRRWDGQSWTVVGDDLQGELVPQSGANSPALALDDSGHVLLGWEEKTQYGHAIFARRHDLAWSSLAAEPLPATDGETRADDTARLPHSPHAFDSGPALLASPDGSLSIAWYEYGATPSLVHVSKFDGSEWRDTVIDGSDAVTPPVLVLTADDTAVVAWSDHDGLLYLAQEADGQYVPYATATSPVSGRAFWPTSRLWRDAPVLAWEESVPPSADESASSTAVHVKRFEGGAWILMSDGLSWTGSPTHAVLAARGDELVLMALQRDLTSGSELGARVARWEGASWRMIGPALPALLKRNGNGGPAIALDSKGRVVVAYKEEIGSGAVIRVVRETP
jgi:hypothetical protein